MRHGVVNNKFRMKTSHRIASFRNMAKSLIETGRVETTLDKAKVLRGVVEPLITLGKKGDLAARRLALSKLRHTPTVHRLFDVIAPVFKERNGGYTRILRLDRRKGDNAKMAVVEFVDPIVEPKAAESEPAKA